MLASYSEPDMITMNQLEANRLNAQKSTGPRTPAGKEASRFNALKHGIDACRTVIPGENQADLERLAGEYQDQICPATPVERYLVDTLISSDWLRRRLHRAQANLYSVLAVRADLISPLGYIWQADAAGGSTLQKVFRQLCSLERSYLRALTELRRIKEEHQPEADQPLKPEGISRSDSPQTGGLGFVPPISSPAAWAPTPDPGPQVPTPISNAFGRFPNGEPLAVRR
jgi:hypothetical protein